MPNQLDTSQASSHTAPDNTATQAAFPNSLLGIHRGQVVDRSDSQNRVRVMVPGVHGPSVSVPELPWAYPLAQAHNTSNPAFPSGGTSSVPPLGSWVAVHFEKGDARFPLYQGAGFGAPNFPNTVPAFSYPQPATGAAPPPSGQATAPPGGSPDNFSHTTPDGTMIQLDNRPGTQKILAMDPKGNYVSIAQSGLVEVKSKDAVSIKGANLITVNCDSAIQIKGNKCIVYASGDLVVEGANSVNVNSGTVVNVQAAKINLNCGSSSTGKGDAKTISTVPAFTGN